MPANGQNGTFKYCSNLKTVIMPPNVISTSSQMFSYCTSLRKVTFHGGFKSVINGTFYRGATNIILDLPSSLTTIGATAHTSNGSGSLIYVLRGNVGTFDGLKDTTRVVKIYVPDEYISNYQTYLSGNANFSKLYPLSEWEG